MPIGAKARISAEQVLAELSHLSLRELDKVLQEVSVLRLEKQKITLPRHESDLLRIINKGLDQEKSNRLEHLQEKVREETISSRERLQLLRLTTELEKLAAERLKALMDLSVIRQTSVRNLMNDLQLVETENV